MFVSDLFENDNKQVLVIYPGRFQPFHKGHAQVFNHLSKQYGANNVYICTSDKVEPPRSPFNFAEKTKMIGLTGIDTSRVIQSTQPYRAMEIVGHYDKQNTILLFAVSAKDMAEDPRFSFAPKKDGSPSYFQPFKALSQCESLASHAYMITVPTFTFTVLGQPAQSATQIRAQYAQADEETRKMIINDLFGNYSDDVFAIMNNKLGAQQPQVAEGVKQEPGETDAAFLDRRAANYKPSTPALRVGDPTGKGKEQGRKDYTDAITKSKPGWTNEDRATPKKPRKGTLAWEIAQSRKKQDQDPEHQKFVASLGNDNHHYGTAKVHHPVTEAHGLAKRVKIVAGPAKGKTGTVGEVRHGAFKGAPKEFTIDLDGGGNVRCSAKELRLISDSSYQTESEQMVSAKEKKLQKLQAQIDKLQGSLEMAREARRMKGSRIQGQREVSLSAKISQLRQEKHIASLEEGMFDRFKKKEPTMQPVTPEQRELIKSVFRNSNADVKWGRKENDDYVLPLNVNTTHGKGRIGFRNEGGVLKASVAYHRNASDAASQSAVPLTHYDVTINGADDLQKLSQQLTEGWKGTVAGLAAAGAIGAAINGTPPSDGSITRKKVDWAPSVAVVQGKEYIKHALPTDTSKVQLTTDDNGNKIYAWVEKSGMRPQYTYYWYAPVNKANESKSHNNRKYISESAKVRSFTDKQGITKYEVLNSKGVTVKTGFTDKKSARDWMHDNYGDL